MNIELPLLAIEAAEEIEKVKKNIKTNLKSSIKLSSLIKRDFTWRLDYSVMFSNAYFSTYNKEISKSPDESQTQYIKEISNKLDNTPTLEQSELKDLVSFCTNLSDHSQLYMEDIQELMEGHHCF